MRKIKRKRIRNIKKSRLILFGFLLLFLSVGYAIFGANLNINGVTSLANNASWDIRFTGVNVIDKSDTVAGETPTISGENNQKIEYEVYLNSRGDVFEFSADIENKGTIDGTIEKITSLFKEDNGEPTTIVPNYLDYSITYLDGSPIFNNHPLLVGEKETIKVHIGLKENLTDEEFDNIKGKTITSEIEVDYVQKDVKEIDNDHYVVTYNTNGGSAINNKSVKNGESIGELPNSTKQGYYIEGWYLENTFDTKVTSSYVSDDDLEIFAKWNRSVQSLNITNNNIELVVGDNEILNITNANEIDETFTFSTSDESIATVDSTGKIIGINPGVTTIIITGDESGQTVEINVVVFKNETITITFNPNGGTIDEGTREINPGNVIGELPVPILEGYYLDGWYTSLTDGVKIDSNYKPMEDKEFFAIWKKSVESLDIVDDNLNIPLGDTFPIEFDNPDGIDEDYTFESGDPNVATVDDDGNVTAIGEGETDITITGEDSGQEIIVHIIVTYAITFNANGGVANPNRKIVLEGNKLGALPETSKDESFLDGWYTGLTTGIPVDEEYEPHQDIELFARWNNAISAAEITNKEILLEPNGEEQINITNKDEIDETYVFASTDENVATVDQDGNVTAVGEGETTITITGDESGDVVVINVVVRIPEVTEYTVVFGANGGTGTMEPQTIQKDTPTKLTKNTFKKQYYLFNGWNTEVDGSGTSYIDQQEVTNIGDTTLYAQWVDDPFPKVFEQEEYNFTGNNYIDTHISLYSSENINKDYEIGFTIVQYNPSSNPSQATLFNTKKEATGYPGLVFRKSGDNDLEIASRKTSSANEVYKMDASGVQNVKIYRISGEIYYSVNDSDMVLLNDLTQYNPEFDLTAWFGAAPTNAAGTGAQRYFVGKMSNMYVKLGTYQEVGKYRIDYNVNGGNAISPSYKNVEEGNNIGTLPIPTREGYYLDGWYTLPDGGVEIDENYIPESNMEIFAKWKKSIKSATIENENISLGVGEEETINITNANEIEETYTFTSSDPSVVTVDENGKVTAVSEGNATITITGDNSNQTVTIKISVVPKFTVTYDANGGEFSNGETTNSSVYKRITKYSHTSNVDDTGIKKNSYGNNWSNSNIVGTDRGDTSKAHVVTIPGANQITVDIYYNGESTSYDWVSVWEGSHPDYTASQNYNLAISGAKQLGGSYSTSYVVNGNNLNNVGHSTLVVNGDTVTFGFVSDGSASGNGYGYYAMVSGMSYDDNYDEPTKEGTTFVGWYTDSSCSDGQEFNIDNNSSDITVYAKYGYKITYDVNGGNEISPNNKIIDIGDNIGVLPNTSREGYYLDGWYTDLQSSTKISESFIPTSNTNLVAKWKKSVASIEIVNDQITLQRYEEELINISNINEIEEDIIFSSNDESIAVVDQNGKVSEVGEGTTTIVITGAVSGETKIVNVVVQYIRYVVSFDSNGGSEVDDIQVIQGNPIGTLPIPERSWYSFDGWALNVDNYSAIDSNYVPSSDVTLFAHWTEVPHYNISFETNGGNTIDSIKVEIGKSIGELPVPTKNKYYFLGWYNNSDFDELIDSEYIPNDNITLYAKWLTTVENINLDKSSVKIQPAEEYTIKILNPDVIEEDYTFISSDDSIAIVDSNGKITGVTEGNTTVIIKGNTSDREKIVNVTVEYIRYTVSFNSLGAYPPYSSVNVIIGHEVGELPVVTREGYIFNGWYTGLTNGVEIDESYVPTKDVTVYARWLDVSYTVTFDSNGGSYVPERIVNNDSPIGQLPEVYHSGNYVLDGWYTNLTDGYKVDENEVFNEDVTLYAKWKDANQYTITFDPNGGTVSTTQRTVYENKGVGNLPVPTRNNYYFGGWFNYDEGVYYNSKSSINRDITLKAIWNSIDYVARIGSNYYLTLEEAVNASSNDDEIVLLKSVTENVNNNKNITLNLNGKTISGSLYNGENSKIVLLNGTISNIEPIITNYGEVVIGSKNSNLNDGVTILLTNIETPFEGKRNLIDNYGSIVLNSGEIKAEVISNAAFYYGINSHGVGSVEMNGGSINITATKYSIDATAITSSYNFVMNGGSINVTTKSSATGVVSVGKAIVNRGNITTYLDTTGNNGESQPIFFTSGVFIMNGGTLNAKAKSGYTIGVEPYFKGCVAIINDGTIISSTSGTTYNDAWGIRFPNGNNMIMNGGTIKASGSGNYTAALRGISLNEIIVPSDKKAIKTTSGSYEVVYLTDI